MNILFEAEIRDKSFLEKLSYEEKIAMEGIWNCVYDSVYEFLTQMDDEESIDPTRVIIIAMRKGENNESQIAFTIGGYSLELTKSLELATSKIDWNKCGENLENQFKKEMN